MIGGASANGANRDFAVVRLNPDGSLDATFSGDGRVTTSVGDAEDSARTIAIQPNARILLAGITRQGTNDDLALVRYLGGTNEPVM